MPDDKDVVAEKKSSSWSEAFKDPKVLVVLITIISSGVGTSVSFFMEIGELRAKNEIHTEMINDMKEKYTNEMKNTNEVIQTLLGKCGS